MDQHKQQDQTEKLPDEFIRGLPQDPFEQLDIARRLSLLAFRNYRNNVERETLSSRTHAGDKDAKIRVLEGRVEELEALLGQTSTRLSLSLEEQTKLLEEKSVLTASVKKLTRDVAKLEAFRRTLMQSLQDEESQETSLGGDDKRPLASVVASASATLHGRSLSYPDGSVDEGDTTQSNQGPSAGQGPIGPKSTDVDGGSKFGSGDDVMATGASAVLDKPGLSTKSTSLPGQENQVAGAEHVPSDREGAGRALPRPISIVVRGGTPSLTPHLTPSVTPTGSPRRSMAADGGRTPRVDGKEFFRQARNRLSYEQFSSFLANIKELNAHRASREETLKKADEIFGPENKDLFAAFEALLTRHLPT